MNTEKNKERKLFELLPSGDQQGKKGIMITGKRLMLGRSECCDVVLPYQDISAIHAVLEIGDDGFKLFDMNSRNGSFINNKKIIAEEFQVEDVLKFGAKEFVFKDFQEQDVPPPVLDVLDPSLPPKIGETSIQDVPKIEEIPAQELPQAPPRPQKVALPSKTPKITKKDSEEVEVAYPLAKDLKAEFSEYIFEDADTIYPIFKYNFRKSSIEVIIIFKDKIFSVDYLPNSRGTYKLVGKDPGDKEIGYAILGKNEKIPFIQVRRNEISIWPLVGYETFFLSKDQKWQNDKKTSPASGPIILEDEDVLRFYKDDIQIFIRKAEYPPSVKRAPILRRDKELRKYLISIIIFLLIFLLIMQILTVDREKDKEKNPERIAKILYKRKKLVVSKRKAIAKTKAAPKRAQQAPKKSPEVKKPVVPKKVTGTKTPKKVVKPKKATPIKDVRDKKAPVVTKRPKKRPAKTPKASRSKAKSKAVSKRPIAKGHVDTYKSFDFKSTVSSLISKGRAMKGVKTARTSTSDAGVSSLESGGESATLKRAKVSKGIGSLTGAARGTLDTRKGAEGLVRKKGVYTVGLPSETVIMGSMDPDVIRQILIDHIPQFRHCYQRILDKAAKGFDGVVPLDFTIGPSGHVTRAGVSSSSRMPRGVKACVVNVLRGIKFPRPMGGGTVGVKQPLNFYRQSG